MKTSLKLVPATAVTTFANSASIFGDMVKKLSSDDVLSLQHAALEELVAGEGRKLLQQLMQDHVALRSEREERLESVKGADNLDRNHVRQRRSFPYVFRSQRQRPEPTKIFIYS